MLPVYTFPIVCFLNRGLNKGSATYRTGSLGLYKQVTGASLLSLTRKTNLITSFFSLIRLHFSTLFTAELLGHRKFLSVVFPLKWQRVHTAIFKADFYIRDQYLPVG